MRRLLAAAAILAVPLAARAASLQVLKSSTVVADQVSTLNPKALPGSDIDFTLTVINPSQNALATVGKVVIVDTIPTQAKLRVTDYGAAGTGPIGFADGSALGTGIAASGLAYGFAGLASTTDGLEFSTDGNSWTYAPVADADGFDTRVRAIRVTLTGTQAAASTFTVRYRTRLK